MRDWIPEGGFDEGRALNEARDEIADLRAKLARAEADRDAATARAERAEAGLAEIRETHADASRYREMSLARAIARSDVERILGIAVDARSFGSYDEPLCDVADRLQSIDDSDDARAWLAVYRAHYEERDDDGGAGETLNELAVLRREHDEAITAKAKAEAEAAAMREACAAAVAETGDVKRAYKDALALAAAERDQAVVAMDQAEAEAAGMYDRCSMAMDRVIEQHSRSTIRNPTQYDAIVDAWLRRAAACVRAIEPSTAGAALLREVEAGRVLAQVVRPVVRDDGTGEPNNPVEEQIDAVLAAVKAMPTEQVVQPWAQRLCGAMAMLCTALADENAALGKALADHDAARGRRHRVHATRGGRGCVAALRGGQ